MIVAGDFNSKSGAWDSPIEDTRGARLADLMASMDLIACNQGGLPTFVRGNSGTYIDVTFVDSRRTHKVGNWAVLEEESLSLHRYISSLKELENQSNIHVEERWSGRKFDLTKLQAYMESVTFEDVDSVTTASKKLASIVGEACNQSMPKGHYKERKKAAYWWTKNIEELRKKCHSLRKHIKRGRLRGEPYQDGRDNAGYREARRELKHAIIRSKKSCWDDLCKGRY